MANLTKTTQDHEEIRRWAEERGGTPSHVKSTGSSEDIGILRIDFPGYSGEGSLEPISWEQWFEKFDERNLALLYQEETAGGERSNFNKIVTAETAEANESGDHGKASGSRGSSRGGGSSSRARSSGGGAKKSGAKAAKKKGGLGVTAKKSSSAATAKKALAAKKKSAGPVKGGAKKSPVSKKAAPVKKVAAKKAGARPAAKKAPGKKAITKKGVAKKTASKAATKRRR